MVVKVLGDIVNEVIYNNRQMITMRGRGSYIHATFPFHCSFNDRTNRGANPS